jgi:hypothetical protein
LGSASPNERCSYTSSSTSMCCTDGLLLVVDHRWIDWPRGRTQRGQGRGWCGLWYVHRVCVAGLTASRVGEPGSGPALWCRGSQTAGVASTVAGPRPVNAERALCATGSREVRFLPATGPQWLRR